MKLKTITTVSNIEHPGLKKLEHSLKMFEWDYQIIHDPSIGWDWGGWNNVYKWCKANQNEYTHVIYTDGFDTLALGPQSEAEAAIKKICGEDLNKFIYSTEKQFFPCVPGYVTENYRTLFSNEKLGLTDKHRWRYVNGGQFAGSIQRVIEWYENCPKVGEDENNQYWGNKYFSTLNDGRLLLDFNCDLFQSVAFSGEAHGSTDEFKKEDNRIINCLLNTKAPLLHGNGRADFQFVYDCLGL